MNRTTIDTTDPLVKALRDEIRQLRKWALESEAGGWSTHQTEPMRRRANDLEILLYSMGESPQ
jgi:hypothetical protein